MFLIYKKQTYIIFLLSFFFLLLGILVSQNEVYGDEWFICGSADGLFGKDNISLMVLCSNYIITGLIHLLSLTGIRLNWFLIIMLFCEFITFCLVFKSFINRCGIRNGVYVFCLFSIIVIPPLYCMHMFTNAGAFILAGGVFWIIYSIRNEFKIIQYIPGFFLILMGISIRFDVIYFSVFFFGIVWLMDVIPLVFKHKKNKVQFVRDLKRYVWPFVLIFFSIAILYITQNILMEKENPGFYDWNKTRSSVDLFPIPDYEQYKEEYEKIGISYTDYKLQRSWNCLDPEFFTIEKYKEILEMKNNIKKADRTFSYWVELFHDSIKDCCDNVLIGIYFFLVILAVIYKNKRLFIKTAILILANILLIMYFNYIERFIQRIEWSIQLNLFFAVLLILNDIDFNKIKAAEFREKFLLSVLLFVLIFLMWHPNGGAQWNDLAGKNIVQQYRYALSRSNNFFYYLKNMLAGEKGIYATHDYSVIKSILEDKKSFYFILNTYTWRVPYPFTNKDIFRTAEAGMASNWGVLGEYLFNLSQIKNNLYQYRIKNPFREIIKNNIKVVCRKVEAYDRTSEIYSYVKEHYHRDISFSIYENFDNVIVGRYMLPFETTGLNKSEKTISLTCNKNEINNFISIEIIGDYSDYKEKYLQLEDSKGNKCVFTFEKGKNIATFYEAMIDVSADYYVNIILQNEDNNYKVIKSNKIHRFNIEESNKKRNYDLR